MADTTSNETVGQTAEAAAPEVLKPQGESGPSAPIQPEQNGDTPKKKRRGTYRPSHKATFIGLIVVAIILVVNAGVIGFVIKK